MATVFDLMISRDLLFKKIIFGCGPETNMALLVKMRTNTARSHRWPIAELKLSRDAESSYKVVLLTSYLYLEFDIFDIHVADKYQNKYIHHFYNYFELL